MKCTPELRWIEVPFRFPDRPGSPFFSDLTTEVLQQKWENPETGEHEWRPVPTAEQDK